MKTVIESGVLTALTNAGFTNKLAEITQAFPQTTVIRLVIQTKSAFMQRVAVSVYAIPYLPINDAEVESKISQSAKEMEAYLNKNNELFPEADYNNFNLTVNLRIK